MIKYTHHCPEHWLQMSQGTNRLADILRGAQHDIYEEITQYFPHKLKLWLNEVLTILMIPILFICILPNQSKRLIKFFGDYTTTDGPVSGCVYANFDNYANNGRVEHDILMINEMLHTGKIHLPDQKQYWVSDHFSTNNKKMELSITNFAINYPTWNSRNQRVNEHLSTIENYYREYHSKITIKEDKQNKYDPIESLIYYCHN